MKKSYEQFIETVEKATQSIMNWVEENTYYSRGMRRPMIEVNVKFYGKNDPFMINTEDFLDFLREKMDKGDRDITPEFLDYLKLNLTEDTIREIINIYIQHEAEYIVFDWPDCMEGERIAEFGKEVINNDVKGLEGRMGGHFVFAEVAQFEGIQDDIDNYIYDMKNCLEEKKELNKELSKLISRIGRGKKEAEEIGKEIDDLDVELEDLKSEIAGFLGHLKLKQRAAKKIIKEITAMKEGLYEGSFEELYFQVVDDNITDFISSDKRLNNYLKSIPHGSKSELQEV